MIRKVALSFLGPKQIKGGRETINGMLEAVLCQFMAKKELSDYKTLKLEFLKSVPTKTIGVYSYLGIAEVEYKE